MVNLVGGLYPALYDWMVEVAIPVIPPGVCLTSDVVVQDLVTSDAEVCTYVAVDAWVWAHVLPKEEETTTLVMACEIDVRGQVIYETLECRYFVTSEVGVRYMDVQPSPSSPPAVCAEVTVWYLTAAIECNTTPFSVVAEVDTKVAVEADVSFCCSETPSWHA
jgi:hypothetical protein